MISVFRAALAIGGSTLIGAGCGFLLHHVNEKWNDAVAAFAAGVMLAAAVFGLFGPAVDMAADLTVRITEVPITTVRFSEDGADVR